MKRLVPISIAVALILMSFALQAAAPHVHGAGILQLVLEGGSLTAELSLPAMDMVGFEHAPREAKHKEVVKKAVGMLKDSRKVLALPDGAQCIAAPGTMESELLEDRHTADPKHNQHEADHGHSDGGTHADFEVAYRFDCRYPEALPQR